MSPVDDPSGSWGRRPAQGGHLVCGHLLGYSCCPRDRDVPFRHLREKKGCVGLNVAWSYPDGEGTPSLRKPSILHLGVPSYPHKQYRSRNVLNNLKNLQTTKATSGTYFSNQKCSKTIMTFMKCN